MRKQQQLELSSLENTYFMMTWLSEKNKSELASFLLQRSICKIAALPTHDNSLL